VGVVNVDVAVVAERHRSAAPRGHARRARAALAVAPDAVFVKGKTNEGLGWIGQGEGLAAHAVAALVRRGG
jgi:2C-methyl-D-erythritol 2,4-cyclodiphosphate synthase